MSLIEHVRLVLEHQLDSVSLCWDTDSEDYPHSVERIAIPEAGGYQIHAISPEGVHDVIDVPANAIRDTDVERLETHDTIGLVANTFTLFCNTGEAPSSLLIEHGIDITALNAKLFIAQPASHSPLIGEDA